MTRGRYLMDGMHPLLQLLFLASLTFIFAFTFTVLGMYLVRPLFGITTIDVVIQEAMSNPDAVAQHPDQVNALKMLQFMSSLGFFLVPAILFALLKFPGGDFLSLKRKFNGLLLLLAIVILVCAAPFISFASQLNQQLDLPASLDAFEKVIRDSADATEKMTELFLKMPDPSALVINIIVMALLPAISEEFFFRGCVQQVMKEWFKNVHIAVWITAFIFSFIHFEFYGFVPRMLLGALLGYLFYWSGNLWVPVISHAFINGAQVVLAYLHEHGMIQFNIVEEEALPFYIVFVSTIMLTGLLFFFKKVSDRQKFIY